MKTVGKDVEKNVENVNLHIFYEKTALKFPKKLKIKLPYEPATLPCSAYIFKSLYKSNIGTTMFIFTSSELTKTWN